MKLFRKAFNKEETEYADTSIVAIADAEMIPAKKVDDVMFAQEMLGQTIAFKLKSETIAAPCNGILEVMYPTGHAFAIRMQNGMGILIHVGINTVNLKGKGFKVLAKQGDHVRAGQKIVNINSAVIKENGYDSTTMLIVSEPLEENGNVNFIDFGMVKGGQIINM